MSEKPLSERVALVTGAARGIGRAIARRLAGDGASVLINFATSHAAAAALAEELRGWGVKAETVGADAASPTGVAAIFAAIERGFGRLDIYINNAIDVAASGPALKMRAAGWEHTVDTNSTAFLTMAQRAAKLMQGRPGRIVSISSLGSQYYIPNYAPIGVAKAAAEALTRYLAVEMGPLGINVNAVSAGPVETDALHLYPNYEQMKETAAAISPARRMGTPEDVAAVVAFLCSDAAGWITGQTIIADGGLSLLSVR